MTQLNTVSMFYNFVVTYLMFILLIDFLNPYVISIVNRESNAKSNRL